MKHKIHYKNEDGSLGEVMKVLQSNDPIQALGSALQGVPDNSKELVEGVFDTVEQAKVYLLEELRKGNAGGDFNTYIIQAYNEQGEPVEEIDEANREAAAADARTMVSTNPDVQMAFNTMVAARQLYGFAFTELERMMAAIAKVGTEDRPPHPLTIEVITQAATRHATREFKADDLFAQIGNNVLPWVNHTIRKNVMADEVDKKIDSAEADKRRRAVRIPIGIKIDPEAEPLMERKRPLILIGPSMAVQFVLDFIVNEVLSARDDAHPDKLFTAIRFDIDSEPKGNLNYLLRVPLTKWTNCARSKEKLGEFVANHVAQYMNKTPDLLVVDDLATTYTLGIAGNVDSTGGYSPYRLIDAHKRLTPWLEHVGMGLVAGVRIAPGRPMPDCNATELERLRNYCDIRPVTVIEGPEGTSRIVIGKDAYQISVKSERLVPPSQIIVP